MAVCYVSHSYYFYRTGTHRRRGWLDNSAENKKEMTTVDLISIDIYSYHSLCVKQKKIGWQAHS